MPYGVTNVVKLPPAVGRSKSLEVKLQFRNEPGDPLAADGGTISGTLGIEQRHQAHLMIEIVELPGNFDCQGACSAPAGQEQRAMGRHLENFFHVSRSALLD